MAREVELVTRGTKLMSKSRADVKSFDRSRISYISPTLYCTRGHFQEIHSVQLGYNIAVKNTNKQHKNSRKYKIKSFEIHRQLNG